MKNYPQKKNRALEKDLICEMVFMLPIERELLPLNCFLMDNLDLKKEN